MKHILLVVGLAIIMTLCYGFSYCRLRPRRKRKLKGKKVQGQGGERAHVRRGFLQRSTPRRRVSVHDLELFCSITFNVAAKGDGSPTMS